MTPHQGTLLTAHEVYKFYDRKGQAKRQASAVDGVSLDVRQGESLGLVGESGSGKSTFGRMLLGLLQPTAGTISYAGIDIASQTVAERRQACAKRQMVFQDPISALNPRRTIAENIELPLLNFGWDREQRRQRVDELLRLVGLNPAHRNRYPHQFSGGQCQRVVIARAIALEPEFLFLDEPVSALDVSVQAQILNLLTDLKRNLGLTYLFVSHDLRLVRHMCDRTVVLFHGQLVEIGDSEEIYERPGHPYTRALRGAVLSVKRTAADIEVTEDDRTPNRDGRSLSAGGCRYAPFCPLKMDICTREIPRMTDLGAGHRLACHALEKADLF
ncbi:ABC transporter ATP-binding protein [Mesorhizobium sp. KR9-304]|uniref:ABC transporter ATP-binding protein n=1 Tax=Mesorhizobium sp. KR9-304 TaxID=3156614 RepID=UPI0032B4FD87